MTAQVLILTPRQVPPAIPVTPRGPSGKVQQALARNPQAPIEAVIGPTGPQGPTWTPVTPISLIATQDGAQSLSIGNHTVALLYVNGLLEPPGSFTITGGTLQIPSAMQIIAGDTITVQPF